MTDEPTANDGNGRSKFSKNMTAWLGGATAVVVALGGLAGAARDLFPSHAQTPADSAADAATNSSDDAASSDTSQTPATPATDQAERITSYTTDDGGTLKLVDGMWLWTDKDGSPYHYKELSNDGTTTVAVLPNGSEDNKDMYLRWPNAGGEALQSTDNQDTWTQLTKIEPVQ